MTAPTCGYCLSTLRGREGTDAGPADGSPCPKWVFAPGADGAEPDGCPAIPRCEDYPECSSCAEVDDCAWCASAPVSYTHLTLPTKA